MCISAAGANLADEVARLQDITTILGLLQQYRTSNRPHLLCGDFNSNAPYQKIDPSRCNSKTQTAYRENKNQLPREVVQSLIDAGYIDTYAVHHNEESEMIGTFDTQTPGQRIDYIFGFGVPTVSVKAAWVEQDRLAKYASDHFPVGAEIELQP